MALHKNSYNVLLVSDSRGRDLSALLNGINTKFRFRVEVLPGARIGNLMEKVKQITTEAHNQPYDLIVLFGGVCNITKITYMPYRAAIPRKSTINEIMSLFEEECDSLDGIQTGAPMLLTPIVGIDLIQYAGQWNEMLYKMQPLVDEVTMMINGYIKRINSNRGLPTPNTSSCIHRCRGKNKGYRTHYQKLFDGCHPNEEIKSIWAKAIMDSCWQILMGDS